MHFTEDLLTVAVSGVLKLLYRQHLTFISCFVFSRGNSDSFSAAIAGPACNYITVKKAAGYILSNVCIMAMVAMKTVVIITASCIPIILGESAFTIPPEDAIVPSDN